MLWATDGSLKNGHSLLMCNSVCTDNAGNSYITGYFADTVSIGPYTLVSDNASDFFIAAFDPNGNVLWAKAPVVLDNNTWQGYSLATDTMGHLYLSAGGYNNSEPFQGIAFGVDTFKLYNSTDATVLLKFDLSGNLLCGSILPSGGDDNNGIATDPSGSYAYLGGDFWNLNYVFGKDTLSGSNGEYPFVVKWSATCNNRNNEAVTDINKSNYIATLFPNPNNSQFTVSLQGITGKTWVEIYNMLGEKVYTTELNTATTRIDMGSKASGIYLYRIITKTGDLVSDGKFIIQ